MYTLQKHQTSHNQRNLIQFITHSLHIMLFIYHIYLTLIGFTIYLMFPNLSSKNTTHAQKNPNGALPLDAVPERHGKRCSPSFRPGDRFCAPRFRYLFLGIKEEKGWPLDYL